MFEAQVGDSSITVPNILSAVSRRYMQDRRPKFDKDGEEKVIIHLSHKSSKNLDNIST